MREILLRIRDWIEDLPVDRQKIALAAAALGLAVFVFIAFYVARQHTGTPVEWSSSDVIDSDAPLQEVLVARARRGGQPPHTDIDLTRIGAIVIAVDLDRIRNRAMYFDAVILDFAGAEVFRDEISEEYLNEGRFLLELRRRGFPSGEYTIEIEGRDQSGITSVLARGTFRVTQ